MIWHYLLHLVVYYTVWFSCVLSAAAGYYWLGLFIAIAMLIPQYIWQCIRQQTDGLLWFMLGLTVLGFIIDSTLATVGIIHFPQQSHLMSVVISPPWMVGLWINFSVVVYACLQAYFCRYWLLGSLALIGFALAYLAGATLQALTLPYGNSSTIIIGAIWAIILPTFTYLT